MPSSNHRAFTLIELIVVIALISIVLAVAIPRLDGGLLNDGSDETARWIIGTVRRLKEQAVADQKTYLLNVSPDSQRMWVTDTSMAEMDADAAREAAYRLPSGTVIDHVAFGRNEQASTGTIPIAFYPRGYSDKAVIRLRTNSGERLAFFIEPFLWQVDMVRGPEGW